MRDPGMSPVEVFRLEQIEYLKVEIESLNMEIERIKGLIKDAQESLNDYLNTEVKKN